MKRLIERLVAVFRTVLGCFGFGGGASSSSAGPPTRCTSTRCIPGRSRSFPLIPSSA